MKRVLAFCAALGLFLSCPAFAASDETRQEEAREAAAAALSACVAEDMTDVEKLTALHDWLALHCDYGATLRGTTAYGALVEGTANCVGYAEGYALLAEAAGLDGVSTYSEALDHAWILATLDGERYFSDCTWDDGKHQKLGLIRHEYWLFDEENAYDVGHAGWDSEEAVPGGELERAPWSAAVTRVIFHKDYAYYIDGAFTLWRCARDTWQAEPLAQLGEGWPDGDELYSSLILIGGVLVFNTPYEICYVDLEGEGRRTMAAPDTSERLIYGVGVKNGRLCCSLAESADAINYEIVDTGIFAFRPWGY